MNKDDDNGLGGKITESWREKMCEWAYEVVDHYEFERELVIIAFNYLDRFFSQLAKMNNSGTQKRVKIDKHIFQLSCATCLYLSMKLHMPRDHKYRCEIYSESPIKFFADLSRGSFSVKKFQKMELWLLQELRWQVHPVTSTTFISLLMSYLSLRTVVNQDSVEFSEEAVLGLIHSHAHFFSELVVVDYSISNFYRASEIALACILAAMHTNEVANTGIGEIVLRRIFLTNIRKVKILSNDELERIKDIQCQIYQLSQHLFCENLSDTRNDTSSPVSSSAWGESNTNYCKKQRTMSSSSSSS